VFHQTSAHYLLPFTSFDKQSKLGHKQSSLPFQEGCFIYIMWVM
jgi:hypothetical protein